MEKMTRPNFVRFRLGEAEKAALHRLTEVEQARQSEVLRMALRELARQRGAWPAVTDEQEKEVQK